MNVHTPLPVRPPRLAAKRRLTVYAVSAGVWASGGLWLLLHYFFVRETAFGPAPHPLEFWSRAAHGAFAFGALWLFGLLWGAHIQEGWRSRKRRWSGGLMLGIFAWLVASGYLLYYLGNELLLSWTMLLHWFVGLAAPLPFVLHRFAARRAKLPAPGHAQR